MKLFKEKKYWLLLLLIPVVWVSIIFTPGIIGFAIYSIYMLTAVFLGLRLFLRVKRSLMEKVVLIPMTAVASATIAIIPLLPAVLGMIIYHDTYPEKGENVPTHKLRDFPVRNATYSFGYSNQVMEFDLSEEEFRELAATRFSQPLQEITKTITVWTIDYSTMMYVNNGLYSEYRQKNGGGYLLVFDREKQRGYYRCSAR